MPVPYADGQYVAAWRDLTRHAQLGTRALRETKKPQKPQNFWYKLMQNKSLKVPIIIFRIVHILLNSKCCQLKITQVILI